MLLRDSFLSTFDGAVIDAAGRLLERLGYRVTVSAVRPNGKALQVLGLERAFARVARRAVAERARLAAEGATLVSLDAATGLLHDGEYREYAEYSASSLSPRWCRSNSFLAGEVAAGRIPARPPGRRCWPAFDVLLHCTEKTAQPETAARWGAVMGHLGMEARFPRWAAAAWRGCSATRPSRPSCRAGSSTSAGGRRLGPDPAAALATGFSCRCQTERFAGHRPRHPVEAILAPHGLESAVG